MGEFTPHPPNNDILETILPNKEHPSRVRGLGKHRTWTNIWSTTGASQSKGFQNEVKTNFKKMQEQMITLQRHVESLKDNCPERI